MDIITIMQGLCIFLLSLWKVYVGPVLAAAVGFNYFEMLSVILLAVAVSIYLTLRLCEFLARRHQRPAKGYNKNIRFALRYWKRYGQVGASLLAPILLGLPVYVFLADRFKTPKPDIYKALLLWSFFWCSVFYVLTLNGLLLLENVMVLPEFIQPHKA